MLGTVAVMRRPVLSVFAAALVASVLGACGGDDPVASVETVSSPATDLAEIVAPAVETTGPDDASTTSPAGPGTVATGPLVAPLELDACLVGEWTVSLETIELLVAAAVLPVPDLTVPEGGFTVTLDDAGTVEGVAAFTAAFSLGTTPAEADVDWRGSGTWSTVDGSVTLSLTEQEGGLTELRLDGSAQAGSELDAELPLAGGDYTCDADRLEVNASTGGTAVPLVFER